MRFMQYLFGAFLAVASVGCSVVYPGNTGELIRVEPDDDWTPEMLANLDEAIALWDDLGVAFTRFARHAPYTLPIHYAEKPWWVTVHGGVEAAGMYVETTGDIFVSPSHVAPGHFLVVCLGHELGHALGLEHDRQGVMQPALPVGDEVRLSDEDLAEFSQRWP